MGDSKFLQSFCIFIFYSISVLVLYPLNIHKDYKKILEIRDEAFKYFFQTIIHGQQNRLAKTNGVGPDAKSSKTSSAVSAAWLWQDYQFQLSNNKKSFKKYSYLPPGKRLYFFIQFYLIF